MNPTTTDADPRFGVAKGLGNFAIAAVCVWEFFRTSDPGARFVMPVVAIARRHRMRPPTQTLYPRWTIVLSLFPFGLAIACVWAYVRWGDVFNLIWSPFLFAMGYMGRRRGLPGTQTAAHMTYAAGEETTSSLPELPARMRWVVLIDKRQIAVMLLENEIPVASATESLERDVQLDYEHQPVDAVEQVCMRLAADVSHQWGFLHVLKQRLGTGIDVRMKMVDWNR